MSIDVSNCKTAIVDNLSTLIHYKMRALAEEQKSPVSDPDSSDARLALYEKQVKTLLKMRQDFEILMSDVHLNF